MIISTNIACPRSDPGGAPRQTGIDKRPVDKLDVFAPGPNYGDGSGVVGDLIGDTEHHGGAHKAVYAYAREELDYWEAELGRSLTNGSFGENLTTRGIDWARMEINQRMTIGSAVLEVSVPRTPCRTFAGWLEEKGWMKRFIARGDCGAYLRVIEPGTIRAGDEITLHDAPGHTITMADATAAKLGDKGQARRVVEAHVLPAFLTQRLARLI